VKEIAFPGKLFIIMGLLFLSPAPLGAQTNAATPMLVPTFTLEDVNGKAISLENLRGKVVMINFWATWCPPCVEEIPAMQDLKESWSDRPFEILAINMGESAAVIRSFMDRLGMDVNFPLLVDPQTVVAKQYQVTSLPATLLIDKKGMFAFGGVGARNWNAAAVRDEILPLFEE
jgi:peroxiredoxin